MANFTKTSTTEKITIALLTALLIASLSVLFIRDSGFGIKKNDQGTKLIPPATANK